MVQVQHLSDPQHGEDDAEYEDVSDAYTDGEEETSQTGRLAWLRAFMGKLSGRVDKLWRMAGSIAWIFTTSMLLVGLPVLFAYDREKSLQEQQLGGLPGPTPTQA